MRVERLGRRPAERAQVTAEYALILGGIAVACILALLWLAHPIDRLFRDPTVLPSEQPFTPPARTGDAPEPASLADCENGGWQTFAFASETDCEDYVTSHQGP